MTLVVWFFWIPALIWDWCGEKLNNWSYYASMDSTNKDIFQAFCFLAIVQTVGLLSDTPKSLYVKFVIKERHGFNK